LDIASGGHHLPVPSSHSELSAFTIDPAIRVAR
jgi:hypothetical protein